MDVQQEFAKRINAILPQINTTEMFCKSTGRLGGYFPDRLRYIRPNDVKVSRKRKLPMSKMTSRLGKKFSMIKLI